MKIVLLLNFLTAQTFVATFEGINNEKNGDTTQGAHSFDRKANFSRCANSFGLYLSAAFLIVSLIQIKKQLTGYASNSFAMGIHVWSVVASFIAAFVSILAQLILHAVNVSTIIFVGGQILQCSVQLIECYIFVQIAKLLVLNQEKVIRDYGNIKPLNIRYVPSD